jgi:hypothetical protein
MFPRIFAAAALVALAASAAEAGTLQNGTWTPSCASAPGDAPQISSKSPDAYNKSAKAVQDWEAKAKAYADCMTSEAKADQNAIVNSVNDVVKKINDQSVALQQESTDAIQKLKAKK